MKLSRIHGGPKRRAPAFLAANGFTLIEMLAVIVIIGIILSIGIPAMRGITNANKMAAANRQVLDDVASARLRAINNRSPVFMVFLPPDLHTLNLNPYSMEEQKQIRELLNGVYTSYALFSRRSVGEQPGRESPRFLSEWRELPEGILIPSYKIIGLNSNISIPPQFRRFEYRKIPFPTSSSKPLDMPVIEFTPQGQLAAGVDEIIPFMRGRILFQRDASGENQQMPMGPTVIETPPGNATNNVNQVRIDWLTGRGRVERPELP